MEGRQRVPMYRGYRSHRLRKSVESEYDEESKFLLPSTSSESNTESESSRSESDEPSKVSGGTQLG